VRRPDEFATGHIPSAINIPNESIGSEEISALPDKQQLILVYCRSGRRSKEAADKLVKLGYTNVVEFGGIQDWKGEIVTENN
jgi:rhodanese-related sulfurtransferase